MVDANMKQADQARFTAFHERFGLTGTIEQAVAALEDNEVGDQLDTAFELARMEFGSEDSPEQARTILQGNNDQKQTGSTKKQRKRKDGATPEPAGITPALTPPNSRHTRLTSLHVLPPPAHNTRQRPTIPKAVDTSVPRTVDLQTRPPQSHKEGNQEHTTKDKPGTLTRVPVSVPVWSPNLIRSSPSRSKKSIQKSFQTRRRVCEQNVLWIAYQVLAHKVLDHTTQMERPNTEWRESAHQTPSTHSHVYLHEIKAASDMDGAYLGTLLPTQGTQTQRQTNSLPHSLLSGARRPRRSETKTSPENLQVGRRWSDTDPDESTLPDLDDDTQFKKDTADGLFALCDEPDISRVDMEVVTEPEASHIGERLQATDLKILRPYEKLGMTSSNRALGAAGKETPRHTCCPPTRQTWTYLVKTYTLWNATDRTRVERPSTCGRPERRWASRPPPITPPRWVTYQPLPIPGSQPRLEHMFHYVLNNNTSVLCLGYIRTYNMSLNPTP